MAGIHARLEPFAEVQGCQNEPSAGLQRYRMLIARRAEPPLSQQRSAASRVSLGRDGEVLIRVAYAGVNPSDSKARSGQSARAGYRLQGVDFPFVTGMDARGLVERTWSNVNEFRQGDGVITWSAADGNTWGSYAEFMRVSARHISPMPKSLNFAQAAAVPVACACAQSCSESPRCKEG